jgi:hypothetical protein
MAITGNFDQTLRGGSYLVGWGAVLREGGAGFFRSHLSSQKRLPIFRLHTRISLKKYPFGTAALDPPLESGAGAVPNGPYVVNHLSCSLLVQGLGTSTAKEGRKYFEDIIDHKKDFVWVDDQDGNHIELAFSKKRIADRKQWLTNFQVSSHLLPSKS